jgi:hypothetical protein
MMLQIIVDELVEATIRMRYESAGRTRVNKGREYRDEGPTRRPPGDEAIWSPRTPSAAAIVPQA